MNRWTDTEKAIAQAQGWDVFAIDGDQSRLAIQRIDELAIFESDDDAVNFVVEKANDGDRTCQVALEITEEA
jgi:hypothetical protein